MNEYELLNSFLEYVPADALELDGAVKKYDQFFEYLNDYEKSVSDLNEEIKRIESEIENTRNEVIDPNLANQLQIIAQSNKDKKIAELVEKKNQTEVSKENLVKEFESRINIIDADKSLEIKLNRMKDDAKKIIRDQINREINVNVAELLKYKEDKIAKIKSECDKAIEAIAWKEHVYLDEYNTEKSNLISNRDKLISDVEADVNNKISSNLKRNQELSELYNFIDKLDVETFLKLYRHNMSKNMKPDDLKKTDDDKKIDDDKSKLKDDDKDKSDDDKDKSDDDKDKSDDDKDKSDDDKDKSDDDKDKSDDDKDKSDDDKDKSDDDKDKSDDDKDKSDDDKDKSDNDKEKNGVDKHPEIKLNFKHLDEMDKNQGTYVIAPNQIMSSLKDPVVAASTLIVGGNTWKKVTNIKEIPSVLNDKVEKKKPSMNNVNILTRLKDSISNIWETGLSNKFKKNRDTAVFEFNNLIKFNESGKLSEYYNLNPKYYNKKFRDLRKYCSEETFSEEALDELINSVATKDNSKGR